MIIDGLCIREADTNDLDAALTFYNTLIDDMQDTEYPPRWTKGVYPNQEDLSPAIVDHSLFLAEYSAAEKERSVVGAFILNHTQDEAYKKVSWSFPADDAHTAVIHLLATGAKYQRQGIGQKLLRAAVTIAGDRGDKVIRLDTLTWNCPGQRLYERFGFHCSGDVVIDYPTTGPIPFRLYEYKV